MRLKLTGSSYTLLVAMVIGVALVFFAIGWPFMSKLLPMIFGGAIFVLAAIQFARELGSKDKEKIAVPKDTEEVAGKKEFTAGDFFVVTAWMAGFVLAIYLLGFVIAIPIFLLAYMKTHRTSWLTSILIAVIATALIYFLFQVGLKVDLYPGLLPKLF